MPQLGREIKRRLKSIASTKKITKAMELVAASKMRKAVTQVLSTRNYSTIAWDLIARLADRTDEVNHPLLQTRPLINKIGLVLITSNRGLCGNFNNQIIHQASNFIKAHKEEVGIEADLVIMGKRGREAMFKYGHTVVAEFTKLDIATASEEIRPLAQLLIGDYLAGKYDKIFIAYTDFVSVLIQRPRIMQLLPIISGHQEVSLGEAKSNLVDSKLSAPISRPGQVEYLFEPEPELVLDQLLPRLLEMQLYQAVLESNASEHSARMIAMRNASEAATDMITDLTLAFNRARQGSITAELADISAGAAGLE
ncbi:MAG: ATP synthase F1 subunit gamma [Candidatus Komeilibacteria bacterium]|nr:ATP synthase F1 subunit gamma [Candidatus Komeilibacteria bacterium]